jgi:hypothetical protein
MLEGLITALMLVVAAIHLVPLIGFFGSKRLSTLYGIDSDAPDLQILMRHRAVLFGLLGAFIAYAALDHAHLPAAFVAAAISLSSFFYLSLTVRGYGPPIRKIVLGDLIAMVALFAAIALFGVAY